MDRIFLIGCPRSGTTWLQTLIASSPDVVSFPETHFFVNLFPHRAIYRKLGVASRRSYERVKTFLVDEIHRPDLLPLFSRRKLFIAQHVNDYMRILDCLAMEAGAKAWLEKTPGHLHYISQIEKRISGAKFIHMIRSGVDVVASLYDASRNYPKDWFGEWTIDECIDRWLQDVDLSLKYKSKKNHYFVLYDNLVQDTGSNLERLSYFLGVEYNADYELHQRLYADLYSLPSEQWKLNTAETVKDTASLKFDTLFASEVREYVIKRTNDMQSKIKDWLK